MSNYTLHGGINSLSGNAEMVDMHGGVLYVYGNVGRLIQHGGIVYRMKSEVTNVSDLKRKFDQTLDALKRANSNTDYFQRNYERLKKENEELKRSANQNDKYTIDFLRRELDKARQSNSNLRQMLEQKEKEERSDIQDDVLIQRINRLQRDLDREKEERKKDIDDLKYNLDGVKEAYFNLLAENTRLKNEIRYNHQQIVDDHIDILASILALYPYTPDKDLEFEFGIPASKVSDVARVLGGIKSKEARQEAQEYLHKQHRELISRRGGDHGNHSNQIPVEKVARNGRVVATYESLSEAAKANNMSSNGVIAHCRRKVKGYTKAGYKFRYKKQ